MINDRTKQELKDIPELTTAETYIYVMLNTVGKIKVGKTQNIQKRYQSLCGSNSQGNKIVKVYCSPATYLHSIESIMLDNYRHYRIQGTEWLYGEDLKYEDVIETLNDLFCTDTYQKCNELRKKVVEAK